MHNPSFELRPSSEPAANCEPSANWFEISSHSEIGSQLGLSSKLGLPLRGSNYWPATFGAGPNLANRDFIVEKFASFTCS